MFRDKYPLAWTFHRNTVRWPFNMSSPPESPSPEPPFKEDLGAPLVPLPEAALPRMPLAAALLARHSCRRFTGAPLGLATLSALLRAAYGVVGTVYLGDHEMLERPVPSGGGLYPLEVYLLVLQGEDVAAGVYHYAAQAHALEQVRSLALPGAFVGQLFMGQPYLARAAAVVVLTAVVERSLAKYQDRGYRYLLLEAGHVAQNLNLAVAALGLGSLNLGGFFDSDMASLLGVDPELEVPLYGIALGVPAGTDRTTLREPPGLASPPAPSSV